MEQALSVRRIRDSMKAYSIIAEKMDKSTLAYEYHMANLLANDFMLIKLIVERNTCTECYNELREEILKYKRFVFKRNGNTQMNFKHRLSVVLLSVSPKLFNLFVKIKK